MLGSVKLKAEISSSVGNVHSERESQQKGSRRSSSGSFLKLGKEYACA